VTLLTPQGTLSPLGVLPRARSVRVVGIYSLGLLEFDSEYGLVSLDFGERLMSRAEPDLIQIRVRDLYDAPAIAKQIEATMGAGYAAQDWASMNQSLFSALWLEKMGISIAVALIVIVGALNIISSLILMVMQKSRDIAILKTMGASARSIMAIFIAQGTAIGIVGTAIGGAGGLTLCWVLDHYQVVHIPIDVYQVSYVPFIVLVPDFVIVVVSAVAICFASTIYPSRQAARLDPVQALRFE
jgi:lipoprotein-releasing system permease protein